MTLPPDNWPRLKVVFADARALPANLRAGYLAVACGDDEALRHDVESLLASDTHAKSFLETPVVLAGTLDEMIDDVQARRERWGMSYVVVGVDVMEQFAPAVARLAGT